MYVPHLTTNIIILCKYIIDVYHLKYLLGQGGNILLYERTEASLLLFSLFTVESLKSCESKLIRQIESDIVGCNYLTFFDGKTQLCLFVCLVLNDASTLVGH